MLLRGGDASVWDGGGEGSQLFDLFGSFSIAACILSIKMLNSTPLLHQNHFHIFLCNLCHYQFSFG
jgi:hypothetical protein